MVLEEGSVREKLIEAWKIRSDETSFSASLSPLVAECRSDDEFRRLFTKQILENIDSATSSNLLQSYFKFHTRSGYIDECLVIENLIYLQPTISQSTNDDIRIKFFLELLIETLKSVHLNSQQALRLGKQLNSLAKWLCSALICYSQNIFDKNQNQSENESFLLSISNLFDLLFNNSIFFHLWLMMIKRDKEQKIWLNYQQQIEILLERLNTENSSTPEIFRQILFKIKDFQVSTEYFEENLEIDPSIFSPIIGSLVTNRLEKCSSILLTILRFYENLSNGNQSSSIYLRFVQSSFGGFLSSFESNNEEFKRRWSSYIHFQFPRLLASIFETNFDKLFKTFENFLVYNEFLLDHLDQHLNENFLDEILRRTFFHVDKTLCDEKQTKINELFLLVRESRQEFFQKLQNNGERNLPDVDFVNIVQNQRSLEKNLFEILNSPLTDENLENFLSNLNHYLPMICALDQYYSLIELLLVHLENHFEFILFLLCYITSLIDDLSEDFGNLNLKLDPSSSSYLVYVWLKKYWLSRAYGHALFGSPLTSIDFLSSLDNSFPERVESEKTEFLDEIYQFDFEEMQNRSSNSEYLSKTILLLGELQSLALDETKQTVEKLISFSTQICPSSLVHVLLWLVANHQIAAEEDRQWIRRTISNIGPSLDSPDHSLFDALKKQICSESIDNPLVQFESIVYSQSSNGLIEFLSTFSSTNSTIIIDKLNQIFLTDGFLDCEKCRALSVCSRHLPTDLMFIRILNRTNGSNGIHETNRHLFFLFALILFRRRSSTRCLFEKVFPYLFNMKSNQFMLEPNVYTMSSIMTILLALELNSNNQQFYPKPWKEFSTGFQKSTSVQMLNEDLTVIEAYKTFFDFASNELLSGETVRPVHYFVNWFQTILWTFSRTVPQLKTFINTKLIAQIAEFFPFNFPVEKVLSIFELNNELELEYASMVITKDFSQLKTSPSRSINHQRKQNSSFNIDEDLTKLTNNHLLTKNVHFVSDSL